MALIKSGDFSELSLVPAASAPAEMEEIRSFATLSEAARGLPTEAIGFETSSNRRGLALRKLHMGPGFQSFIKRLFHMDSKVYFLAWGWDLSGQKVQGDSSIFLYPGTVSPEDGTLIPMKGNEEREFLGDGVVLYPARPITAGITLRLQLWESHSDARKFGDTLQKVADAIGGSGLNEALTVIALATGATTAGVAMVERAALELTKVLGGILKTTSDDYVDYYEGYFPASKAWQPAEESFKGHASEIVLSRFE